VSQVGFARRGRNPDVLTCIANLSNDEVFTPPELADRMLDMVADAWAEANDGASIWSDPTVTFLDPFTKSGVFLRQITTRLVDGLAEQIPDLQERVDHILTRQVFGIAITELTALLARRSLYCSKWANGDHSIATTFETPSGNVWFERTEHTWVKGRCQFCNAPEAEYKRADDLESHAYAFVHTIDIRARLAELFGDNMHFDVIIGNPPYQLGSDGGTRDVPIYQHFVEQAKALDPRFLSMIIPSRWMAGGLGLADFRDVMLNDQRLAELHDYPVGREVFPSVEIKGGVCYFLWSAVHEGACAVRTSREGVTTGPHGRDLAEFDVFVRDVRAVGILRKVLDSGGTSIVELLSADKQFGWTSNFAGFHATQGPGEIPLHYVRQGKRLIGYIPRSEVVKSPELVDTWKVMVPKAGSDGGQKLPDVVLGRPFVADAPAVCTQTYLFFSLPSRVQADSLQTYLSTRFFRFLVSLRKITQDATRSTYTWVPIQTWDRTWTDAELYAKYGLTADEIAYIESVIRPMDLADD